MTAREARPRIMPASTCFVQAERTVPRATGARSPSTADGLRRDDRLPARRSPGSGGCFALAAAAGAAPAAAPAARAPWWAPPTASTPAPPTCSALLAAASLIVGYLNTLFTQTITFAADEFGASSERPGRRRRRGAGRHRPRPRHACSWPTASGGGACSSWSPCSAPVLCCASARWPRRSRGSPSPRRSAARRHRPRAPGRDRGRRGDAADSRAYAVSLLAMADRARAPACAVMALPLADLGAWGWRLVYVVPLVVPGGRRRHAPPPAREPPLRGAARVGARRWPPPALRAPRRLGAAGQPVRRAGLVLPEPLPEGRARLLGQLIALFTLATNTPGGIGIIAGGRLADVHGRRIVGAVALVGGHDRHRGQLLLRAGLADVAGRRSPARSSVAPRCPPSASTAPSCSPPAPRPGQRPHHRGSASSGRASACSWPARLIDDGRRLRRRHGRCWPSARSSWRSWCWPLYPETAHRELEELNPEDQRVADDAGRQRSARSHPTTADATSASAPFRSWRPPSIHTWVDRPGDGRGGRLELVGGAERVAGAVTRTGTAR